MKNKQTQKRMLEKERIRNNTNQKLTNRKSKRRRKIKKVNSGEICTYKK